MVRLPATLFLILLILVLGPAPASAQSDALVVEIQWPNQGETVYGGPSSLLYKIPIKGQISSDVFDLRGVDVQLELYKNDIPLGSLRHEGLVDGAFAFDVTVNPHASTEEFTIGFTDCGLLCHSEGELALQPGRLLARVTATAPDGTSVQAERTFTVDIAGTATIPVDVVLATDGQIPVAGVNVSAATWLYMWRSRFGAAQSDAFGRADVRVEALGQAAARYILRVEPTIVDGVLYQGTESITVDLAPGATAAPAIRLAVEGLRGHIEGQLATNDTGEHVLRAISLPEGRVAATQTCDDGHFTFDDLDVDQYLLVASAVQAPAPAGLMGLDRRQVDLTQQLTETVRLSFARPQLLARGTLLDEAGRALPFGWLRGSERVTGVMPESGAFFLNKSNSHSVSGTLTANAPGYYAAVVPATSRGENEPLVVALRPQPGTRTLPWGAGRIIAPSGNLQEVSANAMTLQRGYLWGSGASDEPFAIATPVARLELSGGRFALQMLPDKQAWLFLFEGQARVIDDTHGREILLVEGQMLNLLNPEGLVPVPYDPLVIAALDLHEAAPSSPVWEPGLVARVRVTLARLGTGTAQLITFLTYTLITLSFVALPLYLIIRHRRHSPISHL